MCLQVNFKIQNNRKPNKDGFLVGYKKITTSNSNVYSSARATEYKVGENISSRKFKDLTPYEEYTVCEGFHISLSPLMNSVSVYKVITVYYKPEDVVAYGTFCGSRCVVVTKMTIKSLRETRKGH